MSSSLLSDAPKRRTKRKKAKKQRPQSALATAQRRFCAELGADFDALSEIEKGAAFERFASFHALRRFHAPEIAPHELDEAAPAVSDGGRRDSVAVIAGGVLIKHLDQVETVVDLAADGLKVDVVVIRATRANRFDAGAIAGFGHDLLDQLAPAVGAETPADAAHLNFSCLDALRQRGEALGATVRIAVHAYYVALGSWSDDRAAAEALADARARLMVLPGLSDADCEAIDRARLLDMIASGAPLPVVGGGGESETMLEVEDYEATLPTAGLVALPDLPGVDGGYSGHVPVSAFLTLLERPDGQGLREAIFHQNVRGFQGEGGVNERIRATLAGPERAQFLLRNNGVTIVSDAIEREGNEVSLLNYQIVNGLQTSTVIYRLRDQLRDAIDVFVPVKLVAAEDWPLRRKIIEATNRQTPITGAALYAASEKAVEIERYFKLRAAAGGPPLYLERRPGQFPPDFQHQRVSLEDLLRVFYAVFREAPQIAEKGFSAIASELDDDLLGPSLSPEPYYVAARLLAIVREAAQRKDDARLSQIEHHAAFALRVVAAPEPPPLGDAVAMRAICKDIELKLGGAHRREEIEAILLRVTESPRQRLRSGAQGVATVKRTKLAVERGARAESLSPSAEVFVERLPDGLRRGDRLGRPSRADVA